MVFGVGVGVRYHTNRKSVDSHSRAKEQRRTTNVFSYETRKAADFEVILCKPDELQMNATVYLCPPLILVVLYSNLHVRRCLWSVSAEAK